jgi:translation initiation factor 2 beta subunit (eIF-2beta)/eIF-5
LPENWSITEVSVPQVAEQRCSRCEIKKPLDAFYKDKRLRHGRRYECTECLKKISDLPENKQRNKTLKLARMQNPEYVKWLNGRYRAYRKTEKGKRLYLKTSLAPYGMSAADYERVLKAQHSVCAICGSPDPGTNRTSRFAVDHCHVTGKVRGLLCGQCNLAIGYMKDRPDLLIKAAEYLVFAEDLRQPLNEVP